MLKVCGAAAALTVPIGNPKRVTIQSTAPRQTVIKTNIRQNCILGNEISLQPENSQNLAAYYRFHLHGDLFLDDIFYTDDLIMMKLEHKGFSMQSNFQSYNHYSCDKKIKIPWSVIGS